MSDPVAAPRITVVAVNFNSGSSLRKALDTLQLEEAGFPALVVDNASTDGSGDLAGVPVVHLPQNSGFAASGNIALARVMTPLVLFVSPDVRLVGGSLAGLIKEAVTHPRAAIIAPLVLNTEGTLQLSLRRFPRLDRECVERLGLHRLPFHPDVGLRVRDPAAYHSSGWVQWASGSVFLCRVDALRSIGGFDTAFFVYATEVDLAIRLAAAGWGTFFSPVAVFTHAGGVRRTDARYRSSFAASTLVARRHYPRTYPLYVILKVVELCIRILVATIRTAAGRQVELHPNTLLSCFPPLFHWRRPGSKALPPDLNSPGSTRSFSEPTAGHDDSESAGATIRIPIADA
jgi:GT2 family glycosyltransferase